MIDQIPVTFSWRAKTYIGTLYHFEPANVWELVVDDYHKGSVMYDPHLDEWKFYNTQGTMNKLADYLGVLLLTGINKIIMETFKINVKLRSRSVSGYVQKFRPI